MICVIGNGLTGFYWTQNLFQLRQKVLTQTQLIEKASTPFGLVHHGVAFDHSEVKRLIYIYIYKNSLTFN